jgi:hypothetical protein
MVEEKFSLPDPMSKSLDNKESTYISTQERKSTEKHKRVTGYLKNTVHQKGDKVNQETVCGLGSSSSSPGEGVVEAFTSVTADWQTWLWDNNYTACKPQLQ